MGKNAWLIVSDLHLYYKNISSHVDYVEEMRGVRMRIVEIGIKYKQLGYSVNLLLLGDVFHRSYNDTFNTGYDNNFFVMWTEKFGEIFSVIGNHELSFYDSNPFFTLVSDVESTRIQKITNRIWTPKGLLPIIRVVDTLQDGEVTFYFNHFGTGVQTPAEGGINIGLFHQEIVDRSIVQMMENKIGKGIWADTIDFSNLDVFDGYQYAFLGHMHMIYGAFQGSNGCKLYYLASLGRTSISEVNNAALERDVPAILVEDGVFKAVESNKFNLPPYEDSIKPEEAANNRKVYELQKAKKVARQSMVVGDNPIQNLRDFFAENENMQIVINGLLKSDVDDVGRAIRQKFYKKFGG